MNKVKSAEYVITFSDLALHKREELMSDISLRLIEGYEQEAGEWRVSHPEYLLKSWEFVFCVMYSIDWKFESDDSWDWKQSVSDYALEKAEEKCSESFAKMEVEYE